MVIQDQEFLHGAAFLKIIQYRSKTSITHLSDIHQSLYLIQTLQTESIILFKISKKPTSAWSFTFSEQEESALIKLKTIARSKLFLALICHKDGICCFSEQQLQQVLNPNYRIAGQRIGISRKINCGYNVTGKDKNKLQKSVSQNNFPRIFLGEADESCKYYEYKN